MQHPKALHQLYISSCHQLSVWRYLLICFRPGRKLKCMFRLIGCYHWIECYHRTDCNYLAGYRSQADYCFRADYCFQTDYCFQADYPLQIYRNIGIRQLFRSNLYYLILRPRYLSQSAPAISNVVSQMYPAIHKR